MFVKIEYLDHALPDRLTFKLFTDGSGTNVGRPSGLLLDRLVNVAYPFTHASIISTKSRTVYAEPVTPEISTA